MKHLYETEDEAVLMYLPDPAWSIWLIDSNVAWSIFATIRATHVAQLQNDAISARIDEKNTRPTNDNISIDPALQNEFLTHSAILCKWTNDFDPYFFS